MNNIAFLHSLVLACSISEAMTCTIGFDRSIGFAEAALQKSIRICNERNLMEIYYSLSSLAIPCEESPVAEWNKFVEKIEKIVKLCKLSEIYEHSKGLAWMLMQYLDATKFIIDCLENAYVSDRKAIEEKLLRLPKVKEFSTVDTIEDYGFYGIEF